MEIGIIGAGNVAWNLVDALQGSPYRVVAIHSRTGTSAARLAGEFGIGHHGNSPSELPSSLDLVLVAGSDHSVAGIAQAYAGHAGSETVFAHTSGSIPLAALAPLGKQTGVFYPLQTFTRGQQVDWQEVPLFLEGPETVLERLRPLAAHLSNRVTVLDSAQRLQMHMGAVFASNFANFMWLKADELVRQLPGVDFQVYGPLIRECVAKALKLGPEGAHTGPARRGDQVTMQKHQELLGHQDQELYTLISRMIGEHFSSSQ